MALHYVLGKDVVSKEHYSQVMNPRRLTELAAQFKTSPRASVNIAGHAIKVKDILEPLDSSGDTFKPIEYGKPLTVEIRWAYTGNNPEKRWGTKLKDMMITSAFKSIAAFNEAPRAVNLLKSRVGAHSNIKWEATDKGTSLAFYAPAIVDSATRATFEVIFDSFPDDKIRGLGEAIDSAARIPVFAPQSGYLLFAGSLLNLTATVGHSIFDGKVVLSFTDTITFARPGSKPTRAGWRILTQATSADDFLLKLKVGDEGQLFYENGKPYDGDFPYIVISLDGGEVKGYEQFTPTAASAALLDKFLGIKEGKATMMDNALEGLKLYSDYRFRKQAEDAQKELQKIKPSDPAYNKKNKELEALKANILHEELKLP